MNGYAVFLFVCGVLFLGLTGMAEGLVSLRYYIPLVALFAAARLMAKIIWRYELPWLPKAAFTDKDRLKTGEITGTLFLVLAVIGGFHLDHVLMEETKRRGDRLAAVVAEFRLEHGRCPDADDDAVSKFRPAIRYEKFEIGADRDSDDCIISFNGPLFYGCSRRVLAEASVLNEWFCDD